MEEYKNMTPIELNVLINKTKDEHESLKSTINQLLDEVDEKKKEIEIKGVEINKNFELLKQIENKYVDLISILMDKQ